MSPAAGSHKNRPYTGSDIGQQDADAKPEASAVTCYRCETPVNDGRWVVDRHGHCVHRGSCPPAYPRDRLVASE